MMKDINSIADLLKRHLRGLPEPLLTSSLYVPRGRRGGEQGRRRGEKGERRAEERMGEEGRKRKVEYSLFSFAVLVSLWRL